MNLKRSSYSIASLLLTGALALGTGCGLKTDPVPPQSVVPKPVTDLRYSLEDDGARLTWSYPLETVNGDDISEIMAFELYRAEMPLEDFCSSCPIPFAAPIEVEGGVIPPDKRPVAEYVSGLLRSGNKYFFKVRSRTSWWADSGDSNIVSFVYHTPAAAPQDFTASLRRGAVELDWAPVTSLADGSPADLELSYQVLRKSGGAPFTPVGSVVQATSLVDDGVQSGTTYTYKVRSLMLLGDEVLDGSESREVSVRVLDTTPPPQVEGVTVVASAKNVRVFWDRVGADDLAGYRVYRRLEGQQEATRLGEVGLTQTIFVDETAPADTKAYYTVTAVDSDGNESKPSAETTSRH